MTVIATDGKTMAADGQTTDNGTITDTDFRKIRRFKDGRIVGMTGCAYSSGALATWLESGGDLPTVDEGTTLLIISPSGVVSTCNYRGHIVPEPSMCAIGSGMDFALAAMEMGASPEQAVEIAIRRDINSGGTIFVEALV